MTKFRLIPYAVLTAAGILAVSGGANAQSMYDINQRQEVQQERIERGIRDGQITRSEAARLEQGERNIDRAQRQAMADGHVTPQERARIDRMTNRESREIYRDSHNDRQAWDRGQQWGRPDGREGSRDHDGWNHEGRREGWGDRREDRREARDGREDRREGWGDRREDRREARDGREDRRGGEHNGMNNGQGGWQHNPGTTPGSTGTGTANNGHGGRNHGTGTTPGTGTGTTGTGTASNGSHSGGWTHGSTGTGTTGSTGTTTTASSGSHTWGTGSSGSTRTVSSGSTRTASSVGTPRSSSASSFSGGGHHR